MLNILTNSPRTDMWSGCTESGISEDKCKSCARKRSCVKYLSYQLDKSNKISEVDFSPIIHLMDSVKEVIQNKYLVLDNKIKNLSEDENTKEQNLIYYLNDLTMKMDFIISSVGINPSFLPIIYAKTPHIQDGFVEYNLTKDIKPNSIKNQFLMEFLNKFDGENEKVSVNYNGKAFELLVNNENFFVDDIKPNVPIHCVLDGKKIKILTDNDKSIVNSVAIYDGNNSDDTVMVAKKGLFGVKYKEEKIK